MGDKSNSGRKRRGPYSTVQESIYKTVVLDLNELPLGEKAMGEDPNSHPMNELAQIPSDENEIAADASEDDENDNAHFHPMNELAQILSDENEIAELNTADASEDGENDNAEEYVLARKNLQDLLLNQTHADLQDQSMRLDEAFAQNLHDVEECYTHGV